MIRNILIAAFLFLSLPLIAQNKDSLLNLLPSVKNEAKRIALMYEIIGEIGDRDPKKALSYQQRLLKMTREQGDKVGEAIMTAELGYAINKSGNSAEGLKMVFEALKLAEQTGNQQAIGIAYNNLGTCYNGDDKKNIYYFQKALEASGLAKDYLFVCYDLGNLSDMYSSAGKLDSALYYNQQYLATARKHKVEKLVSYALVQSGFLQYTMGQKNLALAYYMAALNDPYAKKNPLTRSAAYYELSQFYKNEGNIDSALFYAKADYEVIKNAYFSFQSRAARSLWKLYQTSNSDSALKYASIYYTIRDSVYSNDKVQQMQAMAMLDESRQLKENQERSHNLQYAAIAFGVVIFILFFLLFSHSVFAGQRLIRFLGMLALLIVFEFLNLFLHPFLGDITHHSPVWMLLAMVVLAALLVPLHHKLEHWIIHRMVEKNNRIRLAAARKTIEQLEGVAAGE